MANNSGVYSKPNEIQNIQTTSSNQDDSHIICGQIQTEPTWLSTDIHVKGNLIFESPYVIPPSDRIISNANNCSIICNSIGGTLDFYGYFTDFEMLENAIQYCSTNTSLQWFSNQLQLQTPSYIINSVPSSQKFIVYGQPKGNNVTTEQFNVNYPNPEIGQPDITLRLFGYGTADEWFYNDQYNKPNNSFLETDSNGFRFVQINNMMVEIEFSFQLRYTFDGTQPSSHFAIGLFNVDNNTIVEQSLNWVCSNDIKHKYQTFSTKFTMRIDSTAKYFPFYTNHNNNQWSDTDEQMKSYIKFKFYQFIQY